MLGYLEKNFRKGGQPGLAEIIKGVRITLEKDIPFPVLESASSLEQAKAKYIENSNNPECLTQLMRSFWADADEKSGKTTLVPEFPLKSKEIKERAGQNQMAVFNGKDWVWIEKSVNASNLSTNQEQLEEKFGKEGRQIIGQKTYEVGGQIHKLLYGKYFDEGATYSRVLNANGQVVHAFFRSDGYLRVYSRLSPGFRHWRLGGRFEEVIKA